MPACPYCYAPVKWVTLDTDPRQRIAVDPLPVLHPGPGDQLVAALVRAPVARGTSVTRVGHPLDRGAALPPGHLAYVDHRALCEQLAPDHPRRPPTSTPEDTLI
jgi:hypothetical protein